MDWFLYDRDLCHERVNPTGNSLKKGKDIDFDKEIIKSHSSKENNDKNSSIISAIPVLTVVMSKHLRQLIIFLETSKIS